MIKPPTPEKIKEVANGLVERIVRGAGYQPKANRTESFVRDRANLLARDYCVANRYANGVLNEMKKHIADAPIVFPQVEPKINSLEISKE